MSFVLNYTTIMEKQSSESDFLEYSFLSSCYENGVSEDVVYTLFIEKVIADYIFKTLPVNIPISQFQKHILEKYKIEIPPTYIRELLVKIEGYNTDFNLKRDKIIFNREPKSLQDKYTAKQTMLNDSTIIIYQRFNEFLYRNNQKKIDYEEFKNTLSIYFSKITNINQSEDTEISKILILWIEKIYRDESLIELQKIFDQLMYSWLLFSYFYSVRRSKKKLSNNLIVFDTNLLVYLLGINGSERKFFVEYLLEKLKQNNCSVVVNEFTLKELSSLLASSTNSDIISFRKNDPAIATQIRCNSEEFFKTKMQTQYNIRFSINAQLHLPDKEKTTDLISELRNFKGQANVTWVSAEHDIKLLHSTGALKKIGNIYDAKKLIATSDYVLTRWFSSYMKRIFKSDYTNLLTLDKMNLIFWIESDKCIASGFLMNSWMSVSDSIEYFKNQKINRFLKTVEEKYNQKNIPPENWRSVYLLIKENLPNEKDISDITDDDLTKALDKISTIDAAENFELLQQYNAEKQEHEKTKNELQEVKQQLTRPIIIQQEKTPDEFGIFELLVALLKKVWTFLFKR